MRRTLLLVMVLALPGRPAAAGEPGPTPEQLRFFENKVRPVLATNCYPCHGPQKQRGHLRLDSRSAALSGGESGPALVPGKPEESILIAAVRYDGRQMPPRNRLKPGEVAALTEWVRLGAPWPAGDAARPVVAVREVLEVTDQDRRFWSFQPVRRPPVPRVNHGGWARTPIDAFILHKLEAKGLPPSAPAARRELIRRAYFDLLGLPPAPEEVDAFLADRSPDAYEKLIDRLLASPQYGEHWARHWLDLVRYAQTNGYERDDEKPFAWRYRDYVIRALNEDKPYDQFVREQLAGDQLDDVTPDAVIATGFYRLGVWDDEPDDKLVALYDELDDVLRTTGETFLGLTVGCARCHDHKFDPIPQADYYRLLAFFRNIRPYGLDKSPTHWGSDTDAILTPLARPEQLAAWRARQEQTQHAIQEIQKKLAALGKPSAPGGGSDTEKTVSAEKRALEAEIKKLKDGLRQPPFELALSVREATTPAKTQILVRGNPHTPGADVRPGVLRVLEDPDHPGPSMDEGPARRRLADWIANPDNPLTARVIVNRLWHYHFGRGLVPTPSDFGHTGQPPSHPELLDWLASELVDGGWRLKRLHKLILLSSTFQQSSRVHNDRGVTLDPDNTLLWRQNLQRLTAESLRDAVLAVNGRLNRAMGGRGIFPTLSPEVLSTQSMPGRGWDKSSDSDLNRRSVYVFIKRTLGVPLLETFDLPSPDKPEPVRAHTTIAPQALILLNSSFMDAQAAAFADRLLREAGTDPRAQIRLAFRLALARPATDDEVRVLEAFLGRQAAAWDKLGSPVARPALAALCKLVLNLNEFVYID